MTTKKKIRAKAGDVFQIPIDEGRFCFGQVLHNKGGVLRIVTFNKIFQTGDNPNLTNVIQSDIVLLTQTMDAKIYCGDWKVLGNEPIIDNLPNPKFKFGLDPVYIKEYGGKVMRIASQEEADSLDHEFSVSPVRIEYAMQAFFGVKAWDSDFNKLTYEYCVEKSKIAL